MALSAYINYLRYLERAKREREIRKRVMAGVTTDVQTSDPATPRSNLSHRQPSFSRSRLSASHGAALREDNL